MPAAVPWAPRIAAALILAANTALLVPAALAETGDAARPAATAMLAVAPWGCVVFLVVLPRSALAAVASAASGGLWMATCCVSGNALLLPGVVALAHAITPFFLILPFSLASIAFLCYRSSLPGALVSALIVFLSYSPTPRESASINPPVVFDPISEDAAKEVASARMQVESTRPGAHARIEACLIDFANLRLEQKLGSGAFGDVFKAKLDGNAVAVKMLQPNRVSKSTVYALLVEMDVVRQCKHPNIVAVVGACVNPVVCLVLEYMPRGSLNSYLQAEFAPNEWPPHKTRMAVDIAAGLSYLHNRGLIHGDIKSENLLVGEGGTVKLGDFGTTTLADSKDPNPMQVIASAMWLAPETARGNGASQRADVWSFGVVLCEMITQLPPYTRRDGTCYFKLLDVAQGKISPTSALENVESLPPQLLRVVEQTCELDAQQRTDIRMALFSLLQLLVGAPATDTPASQELTPMSSRRRPTSQRVERASGSPLDRPVEIKRISDPTTSAKKRRPVPTPSDHHRYSSPPLPLPEYFGDAGSKRGLDIV